MLSLMPWLLVRCSQKKRIRITTTSFYSESAYHWWLAVSLNQGPCFSPGSHHDFVIMGSLGNHYHFMYFQPYGNHSHDAAGFRFYYPYGFSALFYTFVISPWGTQCPLNYLNLSIWSISTWNVICILQWQVEIRKWHLGFGGRSYAIFPPLF